MPSRHANALGTTVHAPVTVALGEPELRRDDDLVSKGRERFAEQLFVREGPVGLRRVEERHSLLEGRADERDARALVDRIAVTVAESHATEAEGRDLESAVAEATLFHPFHEHSIGLEPRSAHRPDLYAVFRKPSRHAARSLRVRLLAGDRDEGLERRGDL